ncbi:hypothetical protein WJX82_000971 [Trebouxia sp. C0006]
MRFPLVYAPEKHAGTGDVKRDNGDDRSSKAFSDNIRSPANPASCLDEDISCVTWEGQGECLTNPAFMLKACRQACGACQPAVPIKHQVRLSNGIMMPSVGFGTAGLGEHTGQAVKEALLAGYALFDTAQAPEWYREDLVGQAIQENGTPRAALFLTTKLHPRHHGFNNTLRQMRSSFVNLHTSYLDLVLLHYPR